MPNKYVAFDIETAKDVPGEDFNWRPHRPLGISCAATLAGDTEQPIVWHSNTQMGSPDKQMNRDDAQALVRYLSTKSDEGFKILTWNGLAFDFDILAEESGHAAICKKVVLGHIDMMFHFLCVKGFPIGLEKTAIGMGLPGKPVGMSGVKAPKLWAEGKFKEVLEYVSQDVRVAMQVARACEHREKLEWITKKGTKSFIPLTTGWLTVAQALLLPEPDTSWMADPLPRKDFTNWMSGI